LQVFLFDKYFSAIVARGLTNHQKCYIISNIKRFGGIMAGHEKDENIQKINIKVQENGLIAVKRPVDAVRRKLAKTFNSDVDFLDGLLEKPFLDTSDKAKFEIAKFRIQSYMSVLKDDSAEKLKAKEMYFKYQEQMDKQLGGSTVDEDTDESPLLDFENIQDVN